MPQGCVGEVVLPPRAVWVGGPPPRAGLGEVVPPPGLCGAQIHPPHWVATVVPV